MFKFASLLCLLAILPPPSLLTAQTQTVRGGGVRLRDADGQTRDTPLYTGSYALLIGNSTYADWNHLPGVREDMRKIADALTGQGFEVVSFNPEGAPVVGRPAMDVTRQEFYRQVELFINEYGQGEGNLLLIYYAGHGYTGILSDGRKMGYLVMCDAPHMPPVVNKQVPQLTSSQLKPFNKASISMDEVNAFARKIVARHALFVFDSCFAGAVLSRGGEPDVPSSINEEVMRSVRQFLTAGNELQEVGDDSIFRTAFVDGIEGAADVAFGDKPQDGFVLATELYLYVRQQVSEYTHNRQTPTFGKLFDQTLARGDVVFTVRRRPGVLAEHRPGPRPVAPTGNPQPPRANILRPGPVNSDAMGLNLDSYCRRRYGSAAVPTAKEGDAYSWRCAVRGMNGEESFHQMNLDNACKEQYGPDFGATLGSAREVQSWTCRETFVFDYEYGDSRGERRWFRKSADEWTEQAPDGTTTCFKVVGEGTGYGMVGVILRQCAGAYEVFVPVTPRRGKYLLYRNGPSSSWFYIGVIK